MHHAFSTALIFSSKKQEIVAQSIAEAEFVVVTVVVNQAIWLRKILTELNLDHRRSIEIFVDNQVAIVISNNPVFTAIDLLEIMAKAGPGAFISPSEIAAQLPTKNPEAPVMLDRMFRLLSTYSVLNCTLRTLPDGCVEWLYSLAPVCKFLTKNVDGVFVAPLLLMNQDKVLMESW
ncbi:hypothetical protein CQW23_08011 [Capsicum baccatum]|uniref:O-methyltransferase dimerisation domain-containing protein n=1 Tax=Capsicum baccatum TaxID=33114 RepID=A0A2G2X7Y9_CAPBA|nr:hypothetical protein CQW23_08011 [Capsicum baccatum]